MGNMLLQEKIDSLYSLADRFLHIGDQNGYVYADDLSLLNKSIHNLINELVFQQGKNVEQEAALCLALLMGYSVSMYANLDDEFKKQSVLKRSRKILPTLPPSSVKEQLLIFCTELNNSFEIN
ncbi:UpxZ family transcription anti-terminator antagonist [Bacteroides bouchesdurhonensis]|uniref:UpxZ family transcription anti-terminator antagonist n=2 Tax=Bacteroides bouchesdurhonensis TaxID=1841855 RepID=UPI00097F93F8|nr:UpxZ family transcription anti-terminator antagonist [Bacteroides bouchesdurhonensis]